MSFLDLHIRFGISKQAVRRLVRKGLFKETWGPRAVGIRFELSKAGRDYLSVLEAAAKYVPRTAGKNIIKLKSKSIL